MKCYYAVKVFWSRPFICQCILAMCIVILTIINHFLVQSTTQGDCFLRFSSSKNTSEFNAFWRTKRDFKMAPSTFNLALNLHYFLWNKNTLTLYFTLSFQNGHQVTFGATIPVSHEVSRRFTGTITVATIHAAKWRIHSVENARGAALVARLRRVCVLKNIACRVSRNIKRTASTLSEKYSGKNEKS